MTLIFMALFSFVLVNGCFLRVLWLGRKIASLLSNSAQVIRFLVKNVHQELSITYY